VDVGSNTLRLLISRAGEPLRPLEKKLRTTRLGKDLHLTGRLSEDTIEKSVSVLDEFRRDMLEHNVSAYRAIATAAVRKAANRIELINRARERAGMDLEVISGEEEARLTLAGTLCAIEETPGAVLVFDVGGGSSELIGRRGGNEVNIHSVDIGAVNITERFLSDHDPPLPRELVQAGQFIRDSLADAVLDLRGGMETIERFVGTAGTVTTLAAMLQKMETYDPSRINGYQIKKDRIEQIFSIMAGMPTEQRKRLPGLEAARADIAVAGALIVMEILDAFGAENMIVSDSGLLEGVISSIS